MYLWLFFSRIFIFVWEKKIKHNSSLNPQSYGGWILSLRMIIFFFLLYYYHRVPSAIILSIFLGLRCRITWCLDLHKLLHQKKNLLFLRRKTNINWFFFQLKLQWFLKISEIRNCQMWHNNIHKMIVFVQIKIGVYISYQDVINFLFLNLRYKYFFCFIAVYLTLIFLKEDVFHFEIETAFLENEGTVTSTVTMMCSKEKPCDLQNQGYPSHLHVTQEPDTEARYASLVLLYRTVHLLSRYSIRIYVSLS